MHETPCYRLIIFLACLMKAAEIQAQCGRPDVGENRVMINDLGQQTFPDGSNVTFRCALGYRPVDSSSRTITCVGTQWTKLELNCTKKSCGSLPEFANGKYTYPNGILFGATAVAQCNEGYLLVGQKRRNCLDSGWDGRHPECEAVQCLPPAAIQNGQFEPMEEFYQYNEAVAYSCNKDYTLVGESVLSCSDDENFHPSPPQCLLVQCDTPNIENAVRVEGKSPPYGYKSFVRYQCNEGYKMNGTGSLVCEINGWNPPPPECIMIECETPNIENAVRVEGNPPPYRYKNEVRYQCNEGYKMNGTGSLVCEENGWNPPPPECIINRIPHPPTTSPPSDGTCVKPSIIITAVAVCIFVFLGPKNYHSD